MSVERIIRAWKDENFRQSLSAAERARLPEHPAGLIDLTAAELDALTGGMINLTRVTQCECQTFKGECNTYTEVCAP